MVYFLDYAFFPLFLVNLLRVIGASLPLVKINMDIVSPGLLGEITPSTITLTGPAFDVGIEKLRDLLKNFNISQKFLYDENSLDCVSFQDKVQDILAKWYYRERRESDVVVIVIPGCIESPQVNQLAAMWNVLFISTSNSGPAIQDKSKSPTWITTNMYPSIYYGEMFSQLMEIHNWTSIDILLDENSAGLNVIAAQSTDTALKKNKLSVIKTVYSSAIISFDFTSFLIRFSTRGRVILFLGPPTQLRTLLIVAYSMNMTNGDYVYITALSFPWKGFGNYSWKIGDDNDEIVRSAYGSLLLVTMIDLTRDVPSNLASLMESWKSRYKLNPFYRNTNLQIDPPLPQLVSTTIALEILGQIFNKTFNEDPNFDFRNGQALAQKFLNRTFFLSNGGKVSFDHNGERKPLFVTASFFDVVAENFTVYLDSDMDINAQKFQWKLVQRVRWHNGSQLPPSEPICGFTGKNPACQTSGSDFFLAILLPVAFVVVGVLSLFILRWRLVFCGPADQFWWKLQPDLLRPIAVGHGLSLKLVRMYT